MDQEQNDDDDDDEYLILCKIHEDLAAVDAYKNGRGGVTDRAGWLLRAKGGEPLISGDSLRIGRATAADGGTARDVHHRTRRTRDEITTHNIQIPVFGPKNTVGRRVRANRLLLCFGETAFGARKPSAGRPITLII